MNIGIFLWLCIAAVGRRTGNIVDFDGINDTSGLWQKAIAFWTYAVRPAGV